METEVPTLPTQERKPQETIDSSSRGDIPLRWLTSILLLIFPTATLFVNRGDSYVFGLLTLVGVWVWLRDGARRWLDRPAALLWIAFALFFAIALLSYLLGTQTDAGFRFLGRYLRFLLIVPVYLALRRYPPTAKTVFIGLALGALLAGAIGGLHFMHADSAIRVEATTGLSIIFGDLATAMTLCAVAAFALFGLSRRKWTISLLILCVAGGIAATLLSGSRGAWVPIFLLPSVLMIPMHGSIKQHYLFGIVVVIVLIFSSFYFVTSTGTQGRLVDVVQDIRSYFIGINNFDSYRRTRVFKPVCENQSAFLRAWFGRYNLANQIPYANGHIEQDPVLRNSELCRDDRAIVLHSFSDTKSGWFVFPRIPLDERGAQTSKILVRGVGTAVVGGSGQIVSRFDTEGYSVLELRSKGGPGVTIGVGVSAGKAVWLVPLDSYPGEYTLSVANTSIGQRFELWRAAWTIFLQHPILGAGFGAFQEKVDRLIQQGLIAGFVRGYDHAHNDYLNALASTGIVGFLTLLAILVVPFVRFWRALRDNDAMSHAVGLAGTLTVLGFAIYALTDTIFLHSMMITWYVVYMALFYALLDARAGKLANPEPPKQ